MRPVNLIPPEDRRGEKAPLRTGPLAYIVVGVLAVALVGVTLVVLTSNQISDRQAQKASLQGQLDQAQAKAKSLESFTNFAALQQARQQTVASLAMSRFDWERVLRELAIVIPSDVWLTSLDAKASATAASSTSSTSTSSSSNVDIQGPSLDIHGCAAGHDAVAEFLAALRDVDGVTRATVMSSQRQSEDAGSTSSTSSTSSTGGAGAGCASKDFIASFDVVVAFDDVPSEAAAVPPSSTTPSTPAPTPASSTSDSGSSTADAGNSSGSSGTQASTQAKDGGTFVAGTGSAP